MNCVDCRTQADLDAALSRGDCPHLVGNGHFVVWGSATVEAGDSATVEAGGSATVRAWDSATVRAWGSATVEAGDSASVAATGGVQVRATGASKVTGTRWVVTTVHGKRAQATGGHVIAVPELEAAADWLEWFGIETEGTGKKKVAWLYKAVNDGWKSGHGMSYAPESTPEATDWDGGRNCCGGGLHLGATPIDARKYMPDATRFLRCPVLVSEIAPITEDGMSDKVKVRRIVAPGCQPCDIDGELIDQPVEAST